MEIYDNSDPALPQLSKRWQPEELGDVGLLLDVDGEAVGRKGVSQPVTVTRLILTRQAVFALLPALWGAYAELYKYIDGHEWWSQRLHQPGNSASGWGPLERGIELFQWTIPATAKRDGVDVAPGERIDQLILHFFAVGPEHPPVFSRREDRVVHVWLDQEAVPCFVEELARGLFPRSAEAPRDPKVDDALAWGFRSGTAEDVPLTVTVTSDAETAFGTEVHPPKLVDHAATRSSPLRIAAWSLIWPNRGIFVEERMAESVSLAFHVETLLPLLAFLDEIQDLLLSRATQRPDGVSAVESDLSFQLSCEPLLDLPISVADDGMPELKWFREVRLHIAHGSLGDVGAESWIEEPETLDVRLDVVGLSLFVCEVALAGFDDRPVPSFFDTKCASHDESETTPDGVRMLTRDLMFWPCGPDASRRIFAQKYS